METVSLLRCLFSQNVARLRELALTLHFNTMIVVLVVTSLVLYLWWWSRSPLHGANKGPKIYPVMGSLVEFFINSGRRHDWVTDYMKKSPSLTFRTRSPNFGTHIYTANPLNVEHILKTKFDLYPKGENCNAVFRPLLGNGIFNVDGHLWKSQRKVASHEFSARSLRDFLVDALRTETASRLYPLLKMVAREGRTIDLQDVFMRLAFDNIGLLGFGVDCGCLELSLPSVRFPDAFDAAAQLCVKRFLLPSFLAGASMRKLDEAVKVVDEFAMSVIANRREELAKKDENSRETSKSDLLSRFIQLAAQNAEGRTQKQTDIYVRDMIVNFILAGRDTSSGTLTFLFWIISTHPEVEARIRSELQSIIRRRYSKSEASANGDEYHARQDSSLIDRPCPDRLIEDGFSYDELKDMNYLHAALSETLRFYPSVPSDSKSSLADDVLPDGTRVRQGDRVSYHPYSMGRMESLWGKDCLDFKPERWLHDGHFVQQSPFKFTAFQGGPRTCLGKDMAMVQMKYVAASIFTSGFAVKVIPGQTDEYDVALTLRMKNGLKCKVLKRED